MVQSRCQRRNAAGPIAGKMIEEYEDGDYFNYLKERAGAILYSPEDLVQVPPQ